MLIRFVSTRIDHHSGRREGIFQVATRLSASGHLSTVDDERLTKLIAWFDDNLHKPTRFARSRSHHPTAVAISWFKSEARDCIVRVREMQQILEEYGVLVETITTDRAGYVVYEDEHQVTARPFKDTPH